jgi:diaminopimelate decarboxylase
MVLPPDIGGAGGEPHDTPYKVAGPLCDGGDVYFDIEGKGRLPRIAFCPKTFSPARSWRCSTAVAYSLSQRVAIQRQVPSRGLMVRENRRGRAYKKERQFDDLARNEIFR